MYASKLVSKLRVRFKTLHCDLPFECLYIIDVYIYIFYKSYIIFENTFIKYMNYDSFYLLSRCNIIAYNETLVLILYFQKFMKYIFFFSSVLSF